MGGGGGQLHRCSWAIPGSRRARGDLGRSRCPAESSLSLTWWCLQLNSHRQFMFSPVVEEAEKVIVGKLGVRPFRCDEGKNTRSRS